LDLKAFLIVFINFGKFVVIEIKDPIIAKTNAINCNIGVKDDRIPSPTNTQALILRNISYLISCILFISL
jgi:hypothetical protein